MFRSEMPVVRRWTYFDHAAVAPIPAPAAEAIAAWSREAAEDGDTVWPRWAARVEEVRKAAAAMIAAAPEEIALIANTTAGVNFVAEGFPWEPGDNVVTLANEFPTNQYPWMNLAARGVETRRVEAPEGVVDLDRVAEACDERTRIVSLSWVGFASGWRIDVREAARMIHDRGALFFLDAIQGLGVFPLDVRRDGVDFIAADGHKWLLGPEGAGVFFVRREHLERLRPMNVGWHSVRHWTDYSHIELSLRPEAARYEGGSQNMVGVAGLGASLDLLTKAGVGPDASPVAERVLAVTDHACRRLEEAGAVIVSRRDPDHASGIVSFQLPGRANDRSQSAGEA
ncbi:MAG: aminotransferase class V-fold PLP-dependent enzyme, partial [Planctomycetes bacterium]|nr:aminotransferase class V-fold PLP-dependent enzyme [Planctomycetota bacterium]